MWLILQQEKPDDFVIATGEYHTVREFCTLAFKEVGIELRWEGEGVDEKGIDVKSGKTLVQVDPKYFRPCRSGPVVRRSYQGSKTVLGLEPSQDLI
jgi:GDPmannose 4,6-dehydratase